MRHRDHSLLFLGLAIVLLSLVSLVGRLTVVAKISPPLLPEISLIAFMASGYALLLYRNSLIPLRRAWLVAALLAISAGARVYEAAQAPSPAQGPFRVSGIVAVPVWSAPVLEPII